MQHTQEILCSYCQGNNLQKNGNSSCGTQRWLCVLCGKNFQLSYRYNACKPGIHDAIIEHTLNNSGVRDTARVLKISRNTVCSVLKKKP
jgi:transposase-like protein